MCCRSQLRGVHLLLWGHSRDRVPRDRRTRRRWLCVQAVLGMHHHLTVHVRHDHNVPRHQRQQQRRIRAADVELRRAPRLRHGVGRDGHSVHDARRAHERERRLEPRAPLRRRRASDRRAHHGAQHQRRRRQRRRGDRVLRLNRLHAAVTAAAVAPAFAATSIPTATLATAIATALASAAFAAASAATLAATALPSPAPTWRRSDASAAFATSASAATPVAATITSAPFATATALATTAIASTGASAVAAAAVAVTVPAKQRPSAATADAPACGPVR